MKLGKGRPQIGLSSDRRILSENQSLLERLAVDYVDSYRTRFAFPFMSLDYPHSLIPPATALSFATRSGRLNSTWRLWLRWHLNRK